MTSPSWWPRAGFIASGAYDLAFFILPPLVSVLLIRALSVAGWTTSRFTLGGIEYSAAAFFITAWTYAHLSAVIFRSHVNREVFERFRLRFVVVPPLLALALLTSKEVLLVGLVVAAFWDIYHTSMQNFGFCRLYDVKAGNDPKQGRLLDMGLNHVLYIAPIFVGPSLEPNVSPLRDLSRLGLDAPPRLVDAVLGAQPLIARAVGAFVLAYLAFYVVMAWRMARRGRSFPRQKLWILASTGAGSWIAWGTLPPFQAFFAVNFYHALQYFGIVWWSERKVIDRRFGLGALKLGLLPAGVVFLAVVGLLGAGYVVGNESGLRWAIALGVTISLLHFWYDGFVWSVRKKHVEAVS